MAETDFKWYVGHSDEIYSLGPCASRQAAIEEAVADGGFFDQVDGKYVHAFYLCEATKPIIRLADYFGAYDWVQGLDEDQLAEYAYEDSVLHLSADDVAELQTAVQAAINAWQDAKPRNIKPFRFARVRNEQRLELACDAAGVLAG